MEEQFALVFVEKDDNADLVERFEVVDYPTVVWTDGDGKVLTRTAQPDDAEELLEELEYAVELLSERQASHPDE